MDNKYIEQLRTYVDDYFKYCIAKEYGYKRIEIQGGYLCFVVIE